ncbi:carboxylesterase/lipase family protein [Mycobacterium avium subsp. hominissuis]|uniref:carboxylesterase/lipase family protein n=2 Tax=Mycobacterium avium TaxID=1764 RepID=UPI000452EBD7|nr:carboxylesterase/lipase family protein [Mycobacterium avium]ETZ52822.1 para-nitrobenzyl esterase [Mycobacterium avium MAV_120709_2344]ETZ55751.1 para-nitrobenzyl esterase [Mycobacterium avium MAV_120809_2495]MCA4735498.1 carboxylesterase/lipase family protein [Mycobacterium avium subsp. hominissuis]MCA4740188.1 carboxylesterase/lipase family protein [Mycobacterium avium subsp. hominissuis]MCA4745661.1 carboxylesterase/lipase family protein [Mycobacterium avium subsp. hominissuis]
MAVDDLVVETGYGPVRGVAVDGVKAWKGVRYAAPPIGDLRFRAPQPPERWTEVADATVFGPACPQPVFPNMPLDLGAPQGEDCLRLNVWASADTQPGDAKPVMVWLHGGAYVLGSSSQTLYDGRRLVSHGDVVVVTVNYRLGALGFLDLSSLNSAGRSFDSNVGLRDVLAALKWVRDNITAFGGDPRRVTLFGESAGAGIVTTLLASPAAAGLFAAAIAQSSPATSVYDRDRAARVAEAFLGKLGITASESRRLIDMPMAAILAASQQVFDEVPVRNPGTLAFVPIVDGDVLADYPVKVAQQGGSHPVPLIIGTNQHEAALFRLMRSALMPITPHAITSMFNQIAAEQPDLQLPTEKQIGSAYSRFRRRARYLSIATDVGFRMPSVWLAEGHARVAPVYLYRFDYSTPLLRLLMVKAAHATELPYVWGTLGAPKDPTLKLGGSKTAKAVSKRVRTRWINFAAHAKPAGPAGSPEWAPYQEQDRACLIIGKNDVLAHDVDAKARAAWGSEMVSFR